MIKNLQTYGANLKSLDKYIWGEIICINTVMQVPAIVDQDNLYNLNPIRLIWSAWSH